MATDQTAPQAATILATMDRVGAAAVKLGIVSDAEVRDLRRALRLTVDGSGTAAPSKAVSVRTAAARMECSTKTVRRMIASGQLPVVRITGSRKSMRIPESALAAVVGG